MTNHGTAGDIILEVVRGNRPYKDLALAGIEIRLADGRCEIENTKGVTATAGTRDVAAGLLHYRDDPFSLREWAIVLQASSNFLDLDVEEHPAGEVLLDALWQASFGGPVSPQAMEVAQTISGAAKSLR